MLSRMEQDFIAKAKAERKKLIGVRDQIERELAHLSERLNLIDREITEIDGHLEFYIGVMGVTNEAEKIATARYGDLANMTVVEGCEAILRAEGGRARATRIRELLEKAGKLKGSPNANYATIVQAMKRFPDRFQTTPGSGEWEVVANNTPEADLLPESASQWHRLLKVRLRPADQLPSLISTANVPGIPVPNSGGSESSE